MITMIITNTSEETIKQTELKETYDEVKEYADKEEDTVDVIAQEIEALEEEKGRELSENEKRDVEKIVEAQIGSGEHGHQEVHEALLFSQDILQRALIPFFVIGDVAERLRKQDVPQLDVDEVEIAIHRKHATVSGMSTLSTLLEESNVDIETEYIKKSYDGGVIDMVKTITFTHGGVPVIFKVIDKDYDFFKNLDVRWYYTDDFYIPNPFDMYWEEKDNIE